MIKTHPVDKLNAQGSKISPADPNVLFRFLTENTTEHRAMQSSDDKLFDILMRNLDAPKTRDRWAHLVGENRTVLVVTGREYVWTMSTAAVRLSEHLFQSWVTRASEMKEVSKHPAFRVCPSSQIGGDN